MKMNMKKWMNAIRLRARVVGLGIFVRRTWGLNGESLSSLSALIVG